MISGFLEANISVASMAAHPLLPTIGLLPVSFTSRSENEAKATRGGSEAHIDLHTILFLIPGKVSRLLMTSQRVRAELSDISTTHPLFNKLASHPMSEKVWITLTMGILTGPRCLV